MSRRKPGSSDQSLSRREFLHHTGLGVAGVAAGMSSLLGGVTHGLSQDSMPGLQRLAGSIRRDPIDIALTCVPRQRQIRPGMATNV